MLPKGVAVIVEHYGRVHIDPIHAVLAWQTICNARQTGTHTSISTRDLNTQVKHGISRAVYHRPDTKTSSLTDLLFELLAHELQRLAR